MGLFDVDGFQAQKGLARPNWASHNHIFLHMFFMSHSLDKLFLDSVHGQDLSIGQNVQISIKALLRKNTSPFKKELKVKHLTVTDNQESHLRLDGLNFSDDAIFIKGIGFFIVDEVHNIEEFKLDFPFLFVFK